MSTNISKYCHFSWGLLQPPPHLVHTRMLCDVPSTLNLLRFLCGKGIQHSAFPSTLPESSCGKQTMTHTPHSGPQTVLCWYKLSFFCHLLGFFLDLPFKCSFHCRYTGLCCSWNHQIPQATGPCTCSVSLSPNTLLTLFPFIQIFTPSQKSPPLRGLPGNPKQKWLHNPLALMIP